MKSTPIARWNLLREGLHAVRGVMEAIVKIRLLVALALVLAVSACVVEPMGGGYRGGGWGGHDDGHRVWR